MRYYTEMTVEEALSFFENTLVEEYKKPLEDYVHWFNDIVKRCSNLMDDIEKLIGRELTEVEKWKGFNDSGFKGKNTKT